MAILYFIGQTKLFTKNYELSNMLVIPVEQVKLNLNSFLCNGGKSKKGKMENPVAVALTPESIDNIIYCRL